MHFDFQNLMDPLTNIRYWLRWEVVMCLFSVVACLATSAYLLWRYEGLQTDRRAEPAPTDARSERRTRSPRVIYNEEACRPFLRDLHPGWLLAYRLVVFVFFVVHNIVIISPDNAILYYYMEWTFTLVTVYFGLATMLSIYGCIKFVGLAANDIEHGTDGKDESRELAGFWIYLLQILYQTAAGAVVLTDSVFWFIIFPYNWIRHLKLTYMKIVMHSLNAVFLLGDAMLHSLPFPWFRIAYFFLFTSGYVIFQWSVHASHNIWWPYPFLDMSSKLAPLWYIAAALMQLPCYAAFRLLTKLNHGMLLKWKPVT